MVSFFNGDVNIGVLQQHEKLDTLALKIQMSRCRCKKRAMLVLAFAVVILVWMSNVLLGGKDVDKRFFSVVNPIIPKFQPPFKTERNLRLVSYNIRCDYFHPHTMWSFKERIESLAEGIKDFHIALVQEAYVINTGIGVMSKCASLLVNAMTKKGFCYRTSIADFMAPYLGKSGGIVMFSRIPLARTTSRQFHTIYSLLQYMDYRGFVVGEYIVNSHHLYIVNTHLDPRHGKSRTLQAKELAKVTKNFTTSSHVIVGGDFNIDDYHPTLSNSSEEYIELLKTMNHVGLRSVFPSRMETNIDGGNYDAIFASSNIAVVRREIIKLKTNSNELVSDHFGLAIEMTLL